MSSMYPEELEYYRLLEEREMQKCRQKRMGPTVREWSSTAYNSYQDHIDKKKANKKPFKYVIPKYASLDLRQYPLLVKLDFAAVFLGVIALTVPVWCMVIDEYNTYTATFGLWSYCEYSENVCVSVHDNIIPGQDVPVWYSICQWNFFIGLALNFMTLAILTSNVRNGEVRMNGTIYMAAECFSAMAGLEKFISAYTFVSYIDQADFLYSWGSSVQYHVSFYCAWASVTLDFLTAIVLFLEEEIGPPPSANKRQPRLFNTSDNNSEVQHHGDDDNDDASATEPLLKPNTCSRSVITNDISRDIRYDDDDVFDNKYPGQSQNEVENSRPEYRINRLKE